MMKFFAHLSEFWHRIWSQWSSDPLERCRWIKFPSVRQSRSENPKDQLARAGEEAAADYLTSKGFSVLHRNIRFPEGELDIVAKWGKTLVFVEVKTRDTEKYGMPSQFVQDDKQRRQVAVASRFISLCRLWKVPMRFDVISVVLPLGETIRIEHIENAFRASDL